MDGAFAVALVGLDTLALSARIGENCSSIRVRSCDGLGFLGVELNGVRDAENAPVISAHTGEELMITRSVRRVLGFASGHLKQTPAT